jgi:hypothetical protein
MVVAGAIINVCGPDYAGMHAFRVLNSTSMVARILCTQQTMHGNSNNDVPSSEFSPIIFGYISQEG